MKRQIRIRNLVIGEGIPKICVPIVGVSEEEILDEARNIKSLEADLVEWRVDWYEHGLEIEKVKALISKLRTTLDSLPILFTFRTAREGGEKEIDLETYSALNKMAAENDNIDLIDVEAFWDEDNAGTIIKYAHKFQTFVVLSNHEFQKTPPKEEIISRLCKMQQLDGDIAKIALMPQNMQDVITLLSATEEMNTKYADRPIVTMSMAKDGMISRFSGEIFGSDITFGAATQTSAPGQIPVQDLRSILNLLHKSIK